MKKNKHLMGLLGVFLVSLAAASALAQQNGNWLEPKADGCGVNEELADAILAGDYNAWAALRAEHGLAMHGRLAQALNEGNFGLLLQLHEARAGGNLERVGEIRSELGLGVGPVKSEASLSIQESRERTHQRFAFR